jgi:CHAT domain-containing protein/WD40 domain-containing protein
MAQHTYVDFDLLIESSGGNGYRARVLNSPVGESPPVEITIPFSDLEIENFLLKVGRPRRQATRSASAPEVAAVRDFGGRLFDAVFQGRVRSALCSSLEQVDGREDTGLRVRLRLSDCPELADLPWEYLYDPEARRFLALSTWTPVVRYLDLPSRIKPLEVAPPLRILVMAASPTDFEPLDVETEYQKVRTALEGLCSTGRVELERVPGGTLTDLRRTLWHGQYHVFHFIGHGRYDPTAQDGAVALQGPDGRAQPVSGADLGALLHDHRSLRLAMLNSCEGARGGVSDPYSGTAQSLVHQGIPAVVAMQFEITDQAAITFSHTLYEAVAVGYPLDAAMAEARNAVRDQPNPLEWATPVLYLRAANGRIFDIRSDSSGDVRPAGRDPQIGAEGARAETAARTPDRPQAGTSQSSPVPAGAEPGPSHVGRPGAAPPNDWLATTRDYLAGALPSLRRKEDPDQRDTTPVSPAQFRTERPTRASMVPGHTGASPPVPPAPVPPGLAIAPATRTGVYPGVGACVHAALGPNDLVAAAGADGAVRVLSVRTARLVAQCALPRRERPGRVGWGPWARHVVSGHEQGVVVVWDLETEVPNRVLRVGSARVEALAFSRDGRWLAVAGAGRLGVFDSSGAQVRDIPVLPDDTLPGGTRPLGAIHTVAFAPGDRHVVVAGDDGVVRSFDVRGRLVRTWLHPSAVLALAVSEEGLTTGSALGRVGSWTWDGSLLQRTDHGGRVEHAVLSSDGTFLLTAAQDRTVRVWDTAGTVLTQNLLGRRLAGAGFLWGSSGFMTTTVAGEVETWALPPRAAGGPSRERPS